jgi:hypothetical protein
MLRIVEWGIKVNDLQGLGRGQLDCRNARRERGRLADDGQLPTVVMRRGHGLRRSRSLQADGPTS